MTKSVEEIKKLLISNIDKIVDEHILRIDGLVEEYIGKGYNQIPIFTSGIPAQLVAEKVLSHYENMGYEIIGRWFEEKHLLIPI